MGLLTKTDIKFDELRLYRELQPDATYKWYATVGFKVITSEGETYNKDKVVELKGTQKTQAEAFLTNIYTQIKNEEIL